MKKSFKYRICPNSSQRDELDSIFNFCRSLYNSALEERINYYHKYKKSLSYSNQSKYLPEIKEIFSIKNIYSKILQSTLKQLDIAFDRFFDGIKKAQKVGFPRFKNKNRFKSINFPQIDIPSGGGIKLISNSKIKIFGINGSIKLKMHRPMQGIAKQCRIVKQDDKYFVSFSCDNVPKNILPKTHKITGIDLGIDNFATLDDGTKFHHPKPYKTAKEKLAYRQRKLALKQKGSNNYKKQKSLISKIHYKIVNIRNDYQHKLSKDLVKTYDKIIVEKLNINKMLKEKNIKVKNFNIQDASWGNFVNKISYKAENAGKELVKVNPMNTSKMCSCCGLINKELTLQDRIFRCQCGIEMDRDTNAAKNILALGTSVADSILRSPSL
jgi:putative transposase